MRAKQKRLQFWLELSAIEYVGQVAQAKIEVVENTLGFCYDDSEHSSTA